MVYGTFFVGPDAELVQGKRRRARRIGRK